MNPPCRAAIHTTGYKRRYSDPEWKTGNTSFSHHQGIHSYDDPVDKIMYGFQGYGGCWVERAYVGTAWVDSLGAGNILRPVIEPEELWALSEDGYIELPNWLVAEEARMTEELTSAGLTDPEAAAFLDGWRHTFFDLMPDDMGISVSYPL